MRAGLLAVKSGFILVIKSYQFSTINTLERERESLLFSVSFFEIKSGRQALSEHVVR
jgi:hypothetical protein